MLFRFLVSRSATRFVSCVILLLGPAAVEACYYYGCGRNAYCEGGRPFYGGGVCRCQSGWTGDPKKNADGCIYPRYCNNVNCGQNAYCSNYGPYGSAICKCFGGYDGPDQTHKLVNGLYILSIPFCRETCPTLQSRSWGCRLPQGQCIEDSNGHGSCSCSSGYYGNPPSGNCYDVDECSLNTDGCVDNAECTNKPGSFSCDCNDGYVGIGDEQCYASCDTMSSNCGIQAVCVDDPMTGGQCVCPVGYNGNPMEECYPGCAIIEPTCPANSVCEEDDTTGLGACECMAGYEGENCLDINECGLGAPCLANGVCTNTPGSYTCTCAVGFKLDDSNMCVDIDECTEMSTLCDEHATCTNIIGGYECDCNDGYGGDGTFCEEIDDDRHNSGMMDDPHIKVRTRHPLFLLQDS